ncbi:MAG: DUF2339 domain-containing protein [Acidobacteriota bacterium]|nr:DUF2339 domain-containing protein [Acidobacteriota bacterium]
MLIAIALTVAAFFARLAVRNATRRDPLFESEPAAPRSSGINWTSAGIRFFSWTAAVLLFLAALFAFQSATGQSWLLPVLALLLGVALLIAGELFVPRSYRVTANALLGAGIAVLYATLYGLHRVWHVSLAVTLTGMVLVTLAAAFLSIRRDSLFIALLGLIGGFATPALLGFDEGPIALFSYLLLLNAGVAWIAYRMDWPLLSALSVALTIVYEWAWVLRFLTWSQLPLAAAIFAILAIAGASPLWHRPRSTSEHVTVFRNVAAAAALLPLLFALFIAMSPNYAEQYNVLFGFLFVIAVSLLAIAWRGGLGWLHVAGGVATLSVFFLWFFQWFRDLQTDDLLPVTPVRSLVLCVSIWLALFIALYLIRMTLFAPLLFFAFVGLAIRQPQDFAPLIVAMLLIVAVVVAVTMWTRPVYAAIALALSSLALMALHASALFWPLLPAHAQQLPPPLWLLLTAHAILFAALFLVAWLSERPVLAILAIPFYAGMLMTPYSPAGWYSSAVWVLLAFAFVPYALFMAYAFAMASSKASLGASIAASLASILFLLAAWAATGDTSYSGLIGFVSLGEALVLAALSWRVKGLVPREPCFALVSSAALVFFNAALPMLLSAQWVVMLMAVEAAMLVWLATRSPDRVWLIWSTGLATVVFFWLAFDAGLYPGRSAYLVAAGAMFAAAWFAPRQMPNVQLFFSLAGLVESWFRVNIEIANYYHSTGVALNLDFISGSQREDMTYTVAWALISTGLLIAGLYFDWRGARWGAFGLLGATIFKAFFHDLPVLNGVDRTVSLFALAVSLAVVGVALQKFSAARSRDEGMVA